MSRLVALLLVTTLGGCEALTIPIFRRGGEDPPYDTWRWDTAEWDPGVYVRYGYLGEADVVPGESFQGWEQWVVMDIERYEYLCVYQWTATGVVDTTCEGCDWAFSVAMTDGQLVEGTCDGWNLTEQTGPWGYGFAEQFTGTTYTYTDVMLLLTAEYGWVPWTYGAYDQGVLSYYALGYDYY